MAAVVFRLTVCLILIVLYNQTTCQNINRNLCLETVFAFVDDNNNCNFNNDYAQKSLDDKNSNCQIKCKVNIQIPSQKNNILWEVDISFGRAIYKYVSSCTTNNQFKKINMSIECPEWNTGQTITLPCSVQLNQGQTIALPSSVQLNQVNIGHILGALFGGLLLGVILTTATAVIIYRRSRSHVRKREKPSVFDNDSYAKVVEHNDSQIVQTKDKTQGVYPYSCFEDTSVYNLPSDKPENEQTQDTVYNHLHKQVKQNGVDYYDHAGAAPGHIGDMSDYSHLQ